MLLLLRLTLFGSVFLWRHFIFLAEALAEVAGVAEAHRVGYLCYAVVGCLYEARSLGQPYLLYEVYRGKAR